MKGRDLEGRRTPRQQRARATVSRILDAASVLLDEGGLAGVTTNAVAARAGVNIATLYAYFPNKFAILRALAERLDARREALIERSLDPDLEWPEAVDRGLDGFFRLLVTEPGVGRLLDALRTCPELEGVGADVHERIAGRLTRYLRRLCPGLAPGRARIGARVLVEASSGVVSLARRAGDRERRRIIGEHKRMVRAYLESLGA